MCGFVGTISKRGEPFASNTLRAMADMIAHRGPDDSGEFIHGDWLALAFRRLKIIDLSDSARQPMRSPDGRYVIVFNGEIYNYRELRAELEGMGEQFTTASDTEVLLRSYLKWGDACLNRLVGMFAFIIADTEERTAFAARDQLGIKPLYVFEDSKFIIMCSEVKALLPYTDLKPDVSSFNEYLVFRSRIGAATMFENLRQIPPGRFARISNGKIHSRQYFDLEPTIIPNAAISFDDACYATEQSLRESVTLHTRCDVELGVQLSGGVDSSLLTALASNAVGKKLHTFSISFPDAPEMDEAEFQKRISTRYNTEHHDLPVTEDNFLPELDRTIWHYEHPLNDPNSVCAMLLAHSAKPWVTVMLTGEGADESFMGYTKFSEAALATAKRRTLLWKHPFIREFLAKVTGKPIFKVTRYDPVMFALAYADLNQVDDLLKGDISNMEERTNVSDKAGDDILKKIILQDQLCDLPQWFQRADKMGMAASMEMRVPFCTPDMFALANSIPHHHHLRGGERKAVLKKVAEKFMDHDQIYRKKIGFGVPLTPWIQRGGAYKQALMSALRKLTTSPLDGIDTAHLGTIINTVDSPELEQQCAFLWTYFNLARWHEIFFEGGWKQLTHQARN